MTDQAARLQAYKQRIDQDLSDYCQSLLDNTQDYYSGFSHDVVGAFCSIVNRGGKRLRGALVLNSYEMLGGDDTVASLRVARVVELMHAYLLVIDDICDRSRLRRGGPAAHVLLADHHRQAGLKGDSVHFGLSQATNAALLGQHLAQLELIEAPIQDTLKLEMLHDLNQTLVVTTHGQINDIYNEAIQSVDEAQVKRVLTWKTAYYSFQGPLRLGATLAKADPGELGVLDTYSQHIGLAFQIADDILGTFGNEFESGKSAQDDLKEGKITILISRALERATPAQKEQLLATLGNQQLTPTEYETAKQIIEETGALDYAQQLAHGSAEKAAQALQEAPSHWQPEGVAFLRWLAEMVVNRNQ